MEVYLCYVWADMGHFQFFMLFKSIPCSQFKPVARINSKSDTCESRLDEMEARLRQRGYPKDIVHQECVNLHCNKIRTTSHRMPFISQFYPFSNKINSVIKKHWSILNSNYPTVPEFYHPPLPLYSRGRTIYDRLSKSDKYSIPTPRVTFLGPPNKG